MKRFLIAFVLVIALVLSSGSIALAKDFTSPQGYVSDFAGLLSQGARSLLENQLSSLEKDTGAEVAVVTITDLGGTTVEDYAVRLFEEWGIGKKSEDNGVLFLVALIDRKVRIEVGYGLEPVITDGRAGRILDDDVLPFFKSGDYEAGIITGTSSIEKYIRDGSPPSVIEENPINSLLEDQMPLLALLGIITTYMLGFMARTKSFWLGGVWGVIVGIVLGFASGSTTTTIVLPIITGIVGLVLDYILSKNYKERAASGRSTGWWSSGGGFSGGGGSSFGGFSGGSSGGGGASRGW
jgi:uncharacterized protein